MKVGILSLQGDVQEHALMIKNLNSEPIKVTNTQVLEDVDALIIPGGESTAISLLMKRSGLFSKIKQKNRLGMPIYGSCAGAILLGKKVVSNSISSLDLIDIDVKRNAYGSQIESFETMLNIKDMGKFKGIFIRAPKIEKVGKMKRIDFKIVIAVCSLIIGLILAVMGIHGSFFADWNSDVSNAEEIQRITSNVPLLVGLLHRRY